MRAQRDTAHSSVDACALVFAIGLKTFSVLVDFGVVFTGSPFGLCSADPLRSCRAGAEIAFQALGVITRLRLAAVLIELFRTDFTASTAVQDQTDSRGTSGHFQGTLANGRAGRKCPGC